MNIKKVNTEINFSESITELDAKAFIEATFSDASGIRINITWSFDEA